MIRPFAPRIYNIAMWGLPLGVALACGAPAREFSDLPGEESSRLDGATTQPSIGPAALTGSVGPVSVAVSPSTDPAQSGAWGPSDAASSLIPGPAVTSDITPMASSTPPSSSNAATYVCGDGVTAGSEACDEGPANSDTEADACRTDCTAPRCGDGVKDDDETCDDGNGADNDECTSACLLATCGDGIIQAGESCDDGNSVDDDDCSSECAVPGCGDGIVQSPREECDEAAANSATCTVACRYPRCGDSFVQEGEECDDGNLLDTDSCTALCKSPACGDGIVSSGEACEDGNADNGDGCSAQCRLEVCGDGILSTGESCEDGNRVDGDGCSALCRTEVCGDGQTTGIEQCDDGNRNDDDGCSATCRNEVCGDGIVQVPREDCEDLNTVDTDVCRNGCKHAASLNSLSSSCANTDQITQTVCMVAAANWCKQFNHSPLAGMVTGKKADNEYYVGCITGFDREEASTSLLDQCQPGRQQSPACLEQIRNACDSLGYSRGFYLGTGSSGTFAIACGHGEVEAASVSGCNGVSDTNPVPVACAQALTERCGNEQGGMLQARAGSNQVAYTCIDLSLTGTVRQF